MYHIDLWIGNNRYTGFINKLFFIKISYVNISYWLIIEYEVDSMKIKKKITLLKTKCTSFKRPMIKLIYG